MSTFLAILTITSLAGLLAVCVYHFVRHGNVRGFIVQLLLIGACFAGLFWLFYTPEAPIPKGDGNKEIYFVILLYFFMLLGMFSHWGYSRFSLPKKKRKKFDMGLFVAPVFASPIVFIPLFAALQNTDALQDLTAPKLMVFFVAFENGFFWKEYFDNRRKEKEDAE